MKHLKLQAMVLMVAVAALTALAAGCGSSSDSSSSSGSPSTVSSTPSASEPSESPSEDSDGGTIKIGDDTANDHGTKDASGMSELKVELDDFYFEPTVITGTPGQTIKLELDNEGNALHNFTLTDQSIDEDVQAGQETDVSVTIPQSGFAEFFCKYHRSTGMVGELSTS